MTRLQDLRAQELRLMAELDLIRAEIRAEQREHRLAFAPALRRIWQGPAFAPTELAPMQTVPGEMR